MNKKNNPNKSDLNEVEKVIFRLITVQKNTSGKIEYLIFRDLRGNTIQIKNTNHQNNIDAKYAEIEILTNEYAGKSNYIIDTRAVASLRLMNNYEVPDTVDNAFEFLFREHLSEIVRTNEKILAKMIVKKREITKKGKIRYVNIEGNVIDLNPREGFEDTNYAELLVDIAKYNSSIESSKEQFPNNSYFMFFPICLKKVEYLDNINEREFNQIIQKAIKEFGEKALFMGYEEIIKELEKREREKNEESLELDFNAPTVSKVETTSLNLENNQDENQTETLNKRQLAQRARREKERAEKQTVISISQEEYRNLQLRQQELLSEVEVLRNRNSFLEEMLASTTAEISRIKAEKELNEAKLHDLESKVERARNILGSDLNVLGTKRV